jgi:hypothetical protein
MSVTKQLYFQRFDADFSIDASRVQTRCTPKAFDMLAAETEPQPPGNFLFRTVLLRTQTSAGSQPQPGGFCSIG